MNVWFAGGGYTCLWSFGFAYALREARFPIGRAGGASGGALVALFSVTPQADVGEVRKAVRDAPYSPYGGRFRALGRHERNLAYMAEAILGSPLGFRAESLGGALWVPLRPLTGWSGTWRSRWRSYDDVVDTMVGTGCIPGVSGKLSEVYLDDFGERRGPVVDGGLFSNRPPAFWDPKETISVSPWGRGDVSMTPRPSWTDIACPSRGDMDRFFEMGVLDGEAFVRGRHA